jgi:hypothetical protein
MDESSQVAPEEPTPTSPFLPGMAEFAPGVWHYLGCTREAAFLGSMKRDKFHDPACGHGRRILPVNRLCFVDWEAAVLYGYRPCGVCKPVRVDDGEATITNGDHE